MNYDVAWSFKSSIRAPRPSAPFDVSGADRFPGADLRVRFCLPRGHVRITGWEGGWAEGHMAGWPCWPAAAARVLGTSRPHRWGPAGLELVRLQPSQQLGAEEAPTQPPWGPGQPALPATLPHLCGDQQAHLASGDPRDTSEALPTTCRKGLLTSAAAPHTALWPLPGTLSLGTSGWPQEGPAAWGWGGQDGQGCWSRAGPVY